MTTGSELQIMAVTSSATVRMRKTTTPSEVAKRH